MQRNNLCNFLSRTSDGRGESLEEEESEGSMEGQYNFQADDDCIDTTMFAGDKNSMYETLIASSVDGIQIANPGDPRFTREAEVSADTDDGVKLESFSPKYSPMPTRSDELVHVQVNPRTSIHSSLANNNQNSTDRNSIDPPEGTFVNEGFAADERLSPSLPTPPEEVPVYAQVDKSVKQTRKDSANAVNGVFVGDDELGSSLPAPSLEVPVYAKVDKSTKSEDTENLTESVPYEAEDNGLGDRKDSFVDWPAPPPPSLMDPLHTNADHTSSRDRVASWADET